MKIQKTETRTSAVQEADTLESGDHGRILVDIDDFLREQQKPQSIWARRIRRRLRYVLGTSLWRRLVRDPEIVVRVPPLDDSFVAALKLIAPQYEHIEADERSRQLWEKDQNCSCWIEDAALSALLRAVPTPRNILEIGPGFGRSAVFFSRRYFPSSNFVLFDATGDDTKYDLLGKRINDSFCGNLDLLQRCLDFNAVPNCRIVDARATGGRLTGFGDKFDFIYSFYAIGFHWSVDDWLDEILSVAHEGTLCAFLVPSHYQPSARIAAMPHGILDGTVPLTPTPWRTEYFLVFTPKSASRLPL